MNKILKYAIGVLISLALLYHVLCIYIIQQQELDETIMSAYSSDYANMNYRFYQYANRWWLDNLSQKELLNTDKKSQGQYLKIVLTLAEEHQENKNKEALSDTLDFATWMIDQGYGINYPAVNSECPLLNFYTIMNNVEIVAFLLEKGASIEAPCNRRVSKRKFDGMTALEIAHDLESSEGGYSTLIELLTLRTR